MRVKKREGHLFLTKRQVRMLYQGKTISIYRDKKSLFIVPSPAEAEKRKIMAQMAELRQKLKKLDIDKVKEKKIAAKQAATVMNEVIKG